MTATAYADLEIGLHRRDVDTYAVDLRFIWSNSATEVRVVADGPDAARFDRDRLDELAQEADLDGYGQLLADGLFADEDIRTTFAQARASAESLGIPLHFRLFIGPTAPDLHGLRWETLRDPLDGSWLLSSQRILFSRYLSSSTDWRGVRLRPKGDLCALILIANPADAGPLGLEPIDVAAELERATSSLGNIPTDVIASGGCATLSNLGHSLHEGYGGQGYDILYLVCHGAMPRGEPWLCLEDRGPESRVPGVAGRDLVKLLNDLPQPPRLVVLASCRSAGTGKGDVLAALGPRLAEACIPAVLAMQGDVAMETLARFMPEFFRGLQRHGQIDRAMAEARALVPGQDDAWMPVLFMRVRNGSIWYVPGFAGEQSEFEQWDTLLLSIREKYCTPILGPGLTESLIGSFREIALRWAEEYRFPMEDPSREDLPQVAQFLAVEKNVLLLRSKLRELLDREGSAGRVPEPPDGMAMPPVDRVVAVVDAERREAKPTQPHQVLANFPFPLYITANPDNLLVKALKAEGKEPQVRVCRWNEDIDESDALYEGEPSAAEPLVYHLFGSIEKPDSLVLTQDDYFDFLIGATLYRNQIPAVVRSALVDSALLFLGFRLDDWSFRVLFRSIMRREGRRRSDMYTHVAVQLTPEEGRFRDPERARSYLGSYFRGACVKASIYWGSAQDFVEGLARHAEAGSGVPRKTSP